MTDLNELRLKLDEVDRKIVALFEERMCLCGEVAAYKISTGRPVLDAEREREKITAVQALASSESMAAYVEELYIELMSLSRKLQRQLLAEENKKV